MPPVVIHIGYPKSGSNFLWQYFSSNTDLFVEGGAFIRHYIQSGKISPELAGQTDKIYVISEERLSVWGGHVDVVGVKFSPYPIKSHQEEVCRSLKAAFPEAKILIILRGFGSALRSMYWQYVSIGGIFSFEQFLKTYSTYFADFYDYDFLIRTYRESFGNNVVFLPFELLQEDSRKFLNILEVRCGLPHTVFNASKANASLYDKIESFRILSNFIYHVIQPLPYSLQRKIYGLYAYALYQRKLSWLPNFLSHKPELAIDQATMRLFAGKAKVVQDDVLFEPYRQLYLPIA